MEFSYQVMMRKYEGAMKPHRLAVGDIIRCPGFRLGHREPKGAKDPLTQALPQLGSEGETYVAWRDEERMRSHIAWKNSTDWGKDSMIVANDESRGVALFLITAIVLDETWGPEDVGAPARLYRVIFCSRLTEDRSMTYLQKHAERISFLLGDPMACCSPDPETIEVVGYAMLPIGWSEVQQGL